MPDPTTGRVTGPITDSGDGRGGDPLIDAELLELLACPSDDHAPLRLDGDRLVCTFCASSFPIEDGIAVLLPDEATPGPHGLGVGAGPA